MNKFNIIYEEMIKDENLRDYISSIKDMHQRAKAIQQNYMLDGRGFTFDTVSNRIKSIKIPGTDRYYQPRIYIGNYGTHSDIIGQFQPDRFWSKQFPGERHNYYICYHLDNIYFRNAVEDFFMNYLKNITVGQRIVPQDGTSDRSWKQNDLKTFTNEDEAKQYLIQLVTKQFKQLKDIKNKK